MKPAPKFVLPRQIKDKGGKEITPDALVMDNLETLLSTTVDKDCVETKMEPLWRGSSYLEHQQYLAT